MVTRPQFSFGAPGSTSLYAILDTSYPDDFLLGLARELLAAGVSIFQLRAKHKPQADTLDQTLNQTLNQTTGKTLGQTTGTTIDQTLGKTTSQTTGKTIGQTINQTIELSKQLKAVINQDANNILLINDSPELCQELGADGVHLGQADMPPQQARQILGEQAIIGGTIHNIQEAEAAPYSLLDYVAVGPVFASPTKQDLAPLGIAGARQLSDSIRRLSPHTPVVIIGGIKYSNMDQLKPIRPDALALISALASDPARQAAKIQEKLGEWTRTRTGTGRKMTRTNQ